MHRKLTTLSLLAIACLAAAAVHGAMEMDPRRDATVAAVARVMPSVVNIATRNVVEIEDPWEQLRREFFGPYYRSQPRDSDYSLGSGVVIDEAGYLLTNDHVVQRATEIQVRFGTGTNTYEATVVARDGKTDVALLKLKARPGERFPAIKLAHEDEDELLLGETVLALGNPFGLGGSVSKGILSSKSRLAPREGESLSIQNWLQTDAPINPGNSGGPLVNLRGELIGINVGILREAQGIGFAIPVKRIIDALSDFIPTEFVKSYWFGARVKVGTSPLMITTVQPDSPAGRAGLKAGDAIMLVNGRPPKSFIEFADLLAADPTAGVSLNVQRGAARVDIPVKLVPEKTVFNGQMIEDRLGLVLEPLSSRDLAMRYRLNVVGGCVITQVVKGSPAAASNLQPGMLVLGAEDVVSTDLTALAKVVYSKKKGESVRLDLIVEQRNGSMRLLRPATVELWPRT